MAIIPKLVCSLVGHDFEAYDVYTGLIQRLICQRCGQVFARHIDFGIMPYGQARRKFKDRYKWN